MTRIIYTIGNGKKIDVNRKRISYFRKKIEKEKL